MLVLPRAPGPKIQQQPLSPHTADVADSAPQPQEPGIERLHLREGWDKSVGPFGSQKHFDAAKRKKKVPIFLFVFFLMNK